LPFGPSWKLVYIYYKAHNENIGLVGGGVGGYRVGIRTDVLSTLLQLTHLGLWLVVGNRVHRIKIVPQIGYILHPLFEQKNKKIFSEKYSREYREYFSYLFSH